MRRIILAGLLLSATAATAQPAPPESPALRGLVLALQQVGVAAEQYVNDAKSQLAAKDAKIIELQRLCGEPCKPLAEVKREEVK